MKNHPMTERQRDWLLKALWIGVPASLLHLAAQFTGMPRPLDFLPGALVAGLMIGGIFRTRHDEFIERQFARAAQIALAVAGVMMVAGMPLFGPLLVIDADVGLAVMAVVFNLAFAAQPLASQ